MYNNIIPSINFRTVHLEAGDVIIMSIDPEQINMNDASEVFQSLNDAFPNNTIVGIVKGVDLTFVKSIDDAIKQLEEIKLDMVC